MVYWTGESNLLEIWDQLIIVPLVYEITHGHYHNPIKHGKYVGTWLMDCKYYSLAMFMCQLPQFITKLNTNHYIIEKAVNESNPDVGSSSNTHEGLLTSSNPMDVLLRSPPDIPLNPTPPIYLINNQSYQCILASFQSHLLNGLLSSFGSFIWVCILQICNEC